MKRSFRHWSVRYFWDRLVYAVQSARRQDAPWITMEAVGFLDQWLRPGDVGVEWGSGRSTLWLARRVSRLVSIEHNPQWYDKTSARLARMGLDNVEYVLAEVAQSEQGSADHPYVAAALKAPKEGVDFVFIDGVLRDHCASLALKLLKPGGLLIIDNVDRYLPHATRNPLAIGQRGQPGSPLWAEVHEQIMPWRHYWTTNGFFDTVFYFRPGAQRMGLPEE